MSKYEEMVTLFHEFKEISKPPRNSEGITDYSPAAMERHHETLQAFRARWDAIDTKDWPRDQRVDSFMILAEINGLEFSFRHLRPWFRDAAFYCTQPTWEANMEDAIYPPRELPLDADKLQAFQDRLAILPKCLDQARENLTEAAADQARIAITRFGHQVKVWETCIETITPHHPEVVPAIQNVIAAIESFAAWLTEKLPTFTAPAGVGREAYSWALKHVHLFPYTWEESVALVKRELSRSRTCIKLEEANNRDLPPHRDWPKDTKEFQDRFLAAQNTLMDFVEKHNLFPGENFIKPKPAPTGPLKGTSFFCEILSRDHLPLYSHDLFGHSPDDGYRASQAKEIRRESYPYAIDAIRAEGMATGIEEILMHMGMLDDNRRARELGYILVGFRASRAMAELLMADNQLSYQEGIDYTVEHTPRGYSKDDGLAWDELQCYLRFPGYGLAYLVGKVQLEQLLADVAHQQGDDFDIGKFFEDFLNRGMLPFSLLRWEMTGLDDEMKQLGLL